MNEFRRALTLEQLVDWFNALEEIVVPSRSDADLEGVADSFAKYLNHRDSVVRIMAFSALGLVMCELSTRKPNPAESSMGN